MGNVFKTFDSKASPPKSPTADTSQVQLEAVSGGANEMPQGEMNETMAMSGFFQSMANPSASLLMRASRPSRPSRT